MSTIRWGICGPGVIAHKFAGCIQKVPGAELVAAASRTPGKAKEFARVHKIPLTFDSYEAMAECSEIDAVYVSTAHPFHQSCAELFLRAGKHVLCEKPLCVNAGQAKQLTACAKEHGVFLMEAMWTRFLPAIRETLRLVREGVIGQVLGVEAHFCYAIAPEEDLKVFDNTLAGGSLLDVGIYGLHLAAMVLGTESVTVQALSHKAKGVDLHTQVMLQYEGGAIANISSAITLEKPEVAHIYGTKGRITLPQFYGAQGLELTRGGKTELLPYPSMGEGFEEEIQEACRCIRSGLTESPLLPHRESIAVLELMDTIRRQIGVRYPMD